MKALHFVWLLLLVISLAVILSACSEESATDTGTTETSGETGVGQSEMDAV